MPTQNDLLEQLESLASDMLLAARQENWEQLADLEATYAQLLRKLKDGSNTAHTLERLASLLELNREISLHAARRKEEIAELLEGLSALSTQTAPQ